MVFTALSYLMMSRAFPLAGSVYAYAGRSIGESAGFFAGWAMLPGAPREASIALCIAFNTIVNLIAVLSFLGFDAISTLAEESRGGPTAVGRATMLSLVVVAALFIALTYVTSLFVLGETSFPPGQAPDAAFYNIAGLVGGVWLMSILPFKFLCAGLPAALAAQVATARLLFSMARDGALPRKLSRIHPVRKVPDRAILLVAAVHLVASLVSFGALTGFLVLHLSVIVHFMWRQNSRQWLRHLVAPVTGFTIIAFVLLNMNAQAKTAGAAWLLTGMIGVTVLKRRNRQAILPF